MPGGGRWHGSGSIYGHEGVGRTAVRPYIRCMDGLVFMLTSLESGIGLQIVVWLQGHGSGFADALATLFHYLGQTLFYIPILALIYWSFDKKLGLRMLFALVLMVVVVVVAKLAIQAPRPDAAFPDQVRSVVPQSGYGLPSGHVAVSLVVWGYAAYWLKRRWLWGLLAIYLPIMAWARMYAGVHYPQDVIGGLMLGAAALWLFIRTADPVEAAWFRLSVSEQVAIVLLSVVVTFGFLYTTDDGTAAAGALLGGGLGYILEMRRVKFTTAGSAATRLLRFVFGITLTLLLYFGLTVLFAGQEPHDVLRVIRYMLVTLFAVALWPGWMGRLLREATPDSPASLTPGTESDR